LDGWQAAMLSAIASNMTGQAASLNLSMVFSFIVNNPFKRYLV
jgi:hypothetical protein